MKKQVFTLMATIALLSASPVLAMDEENLPSVSKTRFKIKETSDPMPVAAPSIRKILRETIQHGYFWTVEEEEYAYLSGNSVEDVYDYLTINKFDVWRFMNFNGIIRFSLLNYIPSPVNSPTIMEITFQKVTKDAI